LGVFWLLEGDVGEEFGSL